MTLANPAPDRPVRSPYGWRTHPLTGRRTLHRGIDYGGRFPVLAARGGRVVKNGASLSPTTGFGYYVILEHGQQLRTVYAHGAHRSKLAEGETIPTGEVIFTSGSTGASTGDHLHFEVRTRNRFGVWTAVDPAPFFIAPLDRPTDESDQEEDNDMTPENYADMSTMAQGKFVNGTKCMTVYPSGAIVHTPRVIPAPKGTTERAVEMSRLYGAHQPISGDLYSAIIDAHKTPTYRQTITASQVVDELAARLKE